MAIGCIAPRDLPEGTLIYIVAFKNMFLKLKKPLFAEVGNFKSITKSQKLYFIVRQAYFSTNQSLESWLQPIFNAKFPGEHYLALVPVRPSGFRLANAMLEQMLKLVSC